MDPHVIQLAEESRRQGIEPHVIDFTHFPAYNLLTVSKPRGYDDIGIHDPVPVEKLNLLLVRNFRAHGREPVATPDGIERWSRGVGDSLGLQQAFVRAAGRHIPVVNHPDASRFHGLKPYQYHFLHSHGIRVPATLVTADRGTVSSFIERFGNRVVAKPCSSGAEVVMADNEFFERNEAVLGKRPFMYQQFVSGRSFRTYLLGGRIVSSGEIFFDRRFVDWRERVRKTTACTLETAAADQVEKAVRLLGLAYCAVDLEYDGQTGAYYLLDFNPSALFTGWSKLVTINMAERIIRYVAGVLGNGNRLWL